MVHQTEEKNTKRVLGNNCSLNFYTIFYLKWLCLVYFPRYFANTLQTAAFQTNTLEATNYAMGTLNSHSSKSCGKYPEKYSCWSPFGSVFKWSLIPYS